MSAEQRDHVFISYAVEQAACADWLARRLAAAGYAVWYDRLKLLGGEPWPQDIDYAIKERTYRMLALLSHESLLKANPTGERTTAQQLAKERSIPDFLIPLNITGLRPSELNWTISPNTYIDFSAGWAKGLAALLKKLDSVHTPRVLGDEGARLAVIDRGFPPATCDRSETLYSNCFALLSIPVAVKRFLSQSDVEYERTRELRRTWPCRPIDKRRFLSFIPPPDEVATSLGLRPAGGSAWADVRDIDGIDARDVVVSLVHASIDALFASRGLTFDASARQWYFPTDLVPGNQLRFRNPNGRRTRCLTVGQRTLRGESYRYHLSPSLSVLRGSGQPFLLLLRLQVRLTDLHGHPLPPRAAVSRRKHLCRSWWNPHWLARTLAVANFLSAGESVIRFCGLEVGASPTTLAVDVAVDESSAAGPDELLLAREHDELDTPTSGDEGDGPP